ncbi:MAG: hypothetical protein ACREP9_01460, partial [Candidatus Dormibacteraceae bacterium]
ASRIEGIGPDCRRRLRLSFRQRVPNPDYLRFQNDVQSWQREREDQLRRWEVNNTAAFAEFEQHFRSWEAERRTLQGRCKLAIRGASLALAAGTLAILISISVSG